MNGLWWAILVTGCVQWAGVILGLHQGADIKFLIYYAVHATVNLIVGYCGTQGIS